MSFPCSHRFTLYLMESVTSLDPFLYDHKPCMGDTMSSLSARTQDTMNRQKDMLSLVIRPHVKRDLMRRFVVSQEVSACSKTPRLPCCICVENPDPFNACLHVVTSSYNVKSLSLASLLSFSKESMEFSSSSPS